MLVDSHCHLDHLDLDLHDGSIGRVLSKARERGVAKFLSVGVNLELSEKLIQLAEQYPDVLVSVGVHPLQEKLPELPEIEQLVRLASHPRVAAVGETGIDYYYSRETADWQKESFKRHLQAAGQLRKPVIVHSRNAQHDTLRLIDDHADKAIGGVMHCFTESLDMALSAMEMNFYISFSGIITFKNAEALRNVVREVPLDRILVETDCPWLAPVPYRGKQNQPAYVHEVALAVANIKNLSLEEVAEHTTRNFEQLFEKHIPHQEMMT